MQSHDVIGSNTHKIAQLFPNCVTERLGKDGKPELAIDFEKLQAELSDEIIGDSEERYQFTWPDKRNAVRLANTPTTMTLRPCREESVDFDNTQNLYIEGDNLEVLKVLRETYLGKVKMIYIDPPYNTGNDFVYNDDFGKDKGSFEETSGLFDEEGNQTIDPLQRNTESNGRFHTDWLNMIYPRLKVARDLLTEDGAIFISIDDNEVDNLSNLCNEVFGESNFIAKIVWKKKTGAGANITHVFNEHEYVLCYSKNKLVLKKWRIINPEDGDFRNPDNDPNGAWQSCALTAPSKNRNPNQLYKIEVHFNKEIVESYDDTSIFEQFIYNGHTIILKHVIGEIVDNSEFDPINNIASFTKRWAYAKQNIRELFNQNKIYLNGRNVPRYKKYEKENEGKALRSIYFDEFSTQQGSEALSKLFDVNLLEYPKPVNLIQYLLKACTEQYDIILDFFSGSATTAHAVMKLNAEDGGNRKFIMVQLPEKTDEKSEAYKAGYKNICEIGKERIRRAGKKIKEEAGLQAQNLDTGFRVLKLDSSNMEDVYYTPQEFELQSLFMENVKADRTSEDLLFQVMLDLGVELSVKIENEKLKVKDGRTITVHNVDEGYLMACFDRDIDEATITEIAKRQPVYFVMRDASAASDNVIDNFEQIFKHYSPDTICRII